MFKTFLGCWINYYDLDQLPWNFFMIGFICHIWNEINWYTLTWVKNVAGHGNRTHGLLVTSYPLGLITPETLRVICFCCNQRGLKMTQINSQPSKKLSVYATKMEPFKRPWTKKSGKLRFTIFVSFCGYFWSITSPWPNSVNYFFFLLKCTFLQKMITSLCICVTKTLDYLPIKTSVLRFWPISYQIS